MRSNKLAVIIITFFSILAIAAVAQDKAKANLAAKVQQAPHPQVVAYYFHGNARCKTCRKLEAASYQVITTEFPEQLKSGLLSWQLVNMDQPENTHFIKDYQLVTRSLVIVRKENGKQVAYKNLQEIWKLVNKDAEFRDYVKGEVQALLGSK